MLESVMETEWYFSHFPGNVQRLTVYFLTFF